MTGEDAVPSLARGVKFRHDPVRDAWVILAPERLLLPDETACAVLREMDGTRSLGDIVTRLATAYDAPRDAIAADVAAMLRDLRDKGIVTL